MDSWMLSLRRGVVSGASASILSALALALCSQREARTPFAGVNAVSHWIWGDRAARQNAPSLKHTLLGYAIHHASASFWAVLFERFAGKLLDRRAIAPTLEAAAAASAIACFTDYQLTPHRLQPGYEMRLSRPSLALVYAAFGVGLAAGAMLNRR